MLVKHPPLISALRGALVLSILLCSACAKDPSQDVPQAQVSSTTETSNQAATAASAKSKQPTPSATAESANPANDQSATSGSSMKLTGEIVFIGSKVTGSHTNRFKTWTGSVTLGEGQSLAGAQFQFSVETASVEACLLYTSDAADE